ncbi:hypothetical protein PS903_04296 [Pseudomonas fluorescens]|nr:hypothetical protein PS903_04296 [Pseudomonas fluorescens]
MQSQPTTLLCRYSYDPLDRLTSHTLTQTRERQRFYCINRLTTEIQGAMKHSIVRRDDLLLAQQQIEGEVLDTTLLVTDHQGSVLQTFEADHPPQAFAYSPYGHRRPEHALLSLLGFNGEQPDPVTGHYLLGNGYRAFNPALMRFNSPDSMSPFGRGGLNPYAYCLGDPVNLIDSNGNFALPNFLSKAFNRTLKMFGKQDKIYISSPEKIFKNSMRSNTTTTTTTLKSGPTRTLETGTLSATSDTITLRTMNIDGDHILISDRKGLEIHSKANPRLVELARSQIPGKHLDDSYSWIQMSSDIDFMNLSNATSRRIRSATNNASLSSAQIDSITRKTANDARRGIVNGVRPSAFNTQ